MFETFHAPKISCSENFTFDKNLCKKKLYSKIFIIETFHGRKNHVRKFVCSKKITFEKIYITKKQYCELSQLFNKKKNEKSMKAAKSSQKVARYNQ